MYTHINQTNKILTGLRIILLLYIIAPSYGFFLINLIAVKTLFEY